MVHGVDIALAHEDAVVGTDQHRAERVVAVRDRIAGDGVGSTQVSKYLVAGHLLNRQPPDGRLHRAEIVRKGRQLQERTLTGERPPAHRLATPAWYQKSFRGAVELIEATRITSLATVSLVRGWLPLRDKGSNVLDQLHIHKSVFANPLLCIRKHNNSTRNCGKDPRSRV